MNSTALQRRRERTEAFRENWLTLNLYERFEQVVALVLSALIVIIVAMAVLDLCKEVLLLVWRGLLDPLDHTMFQRIFGAIMTLLITMEFKHTLVKVIAGGDRIIQVKVVLLIAVLALARKFIILDPVQYTAATIFALGAAILALSAAYWLIHERWRR